MRSIYTVDDAIAAINMDECYRRRRVRGRDLNDWLVPLKDLRKAGETRAALDLLAEIIAAIETLEQFDPREPQPYWYEEAAKVYRRLKCRQEEADVLNRWLAFWPEQRARHDRARERVRARIEYVTTRFHLPS